jgi:hypothetical protein
MRNCTRDEGWPLGFGNQALISTYRKLLRSRAVVVRVAEKPGQDSGRHSRERRAQANRCRSVEKRLGDVRTGGCLFLWDQLGGRLRLPERHPACRRREARPDCRMERENLCSAARWREGRSRKRLQPRGREYGCGARGCSARSGVEGPVMGWSEGAALFSLGHWPTGNGRSWSAKQGRSRSQSAQISGEAPPPFINRCGGLKIGVR